MTERTPLTYDILMELVESEAGILLSLEQGIWYLTVSTKNRQPLAIPVEYSVGGMYLTVLNFLSEGTVHFETENQQYTGQLKAVPK